MPLTPISPAPDESLTPRSRRPTVRDVAARAGVSVATVDRVLNRRAPVASETARRVLEAAQAIGFHASALIGRRIAERVEERRLGFLLQRRGDSFYEALGAELVRATRAAAGFTGRPMLHHLEDLSPGRVAAAIDDLGRRCDALAIVAADHPRVAEAVAGASARHVPVYALLSDLSAPERSGFVGIDHRKAGRTAAWAVTRLARAPGPVGILLGSHRYLGHETSEMSFRSYCREHAPAFELLEAGVSFENPAFAHEATIDLLRRAPGLVGLYVAGGGQEGVIAALREEDAGRRVVTVCNELMPTSRAALLDGIVDLVIGTPVRALAECTVSLMGEALSGRGGNAPRQIVLPLEVFVSENV